jgi:hypothetical protein
MAASSASSFCRRFEMHLMQRSLWIGDLFTMEDARSQGIGCALLAAVTAKQPLSQIPELPGPITV